MVVHAYSPTALERWRQGDLRSLLASKPHPIGKLWVPFQKIRKTPGSNICPQTHNLHESPYMKTYTPEKGGERKRDAHSNDSAYFSVDEPGHVWLR